MSFKEYTDDDMAFQYEMQQAKDTFCKRHADKEGNMKAQTIWHEIFNPRGTKAMCCVCIIMINNYWHSEDNGDNDDVTAAKIAARAKNRSEITEVALRIHNLIVYFDLDAKVVCFNPPAYLPITICMNKGY